MRIWNTPLGSYPCGPFARRWAARAARPEATSNGSARAISATTRPRRRRLRPAPTVIVRPPSRSGAVGVTPETEMAGHSPNTRHVSAVAAIMTSARRTSIPSSVHPLTNGMIFAGIASRIARRASQPAARARGTAAPRAPCSRQKAGGRFARGSRRARAEFQARLDDPIRGRPGGPRH